MSVILLGAFIGICSALLGLGGNILIVPILPLVSELTLSEVIATGIFTVFLVTVVNVSSFYRQGLIDFKLITILFIPTTVGSFVSSHFAPNFSENFIRILLIIVMCLMIAKLVINIRQQMSLKYKTFILVVAGFISGSLAGLTGIGTGILLAPLLLAFHLTAANKVSPTINFLIMLACASASLNYLDFTHWEGSKWGSVRVDYVVTLFLPALLTSKIGRSFNQTIQPRRRKLLVGASLSILAVKELLTLMA